MELNYDWKSFQSIFYSKKKTSRLPEVSSAPIYLVLEGTVIISALSEGEDLSDWIGATADEIKAEFSHREFVSFTREKVDQWMATASDLPHYYDQIQYYRNEAKDLLIPRILIKNNDSLVQQHFLLQAIQGWWQKVLPSTYGLYLRLEDEGGLGTGGSGSTASAGGGAGAAGGSSSTGSSSAPVPNAGAMSGCSSLFMVIQRGRIDSFHSPDLSSIMSEKRRQPAEIVRHLSERYLIPVQGMFLTTAEWAEWSASPNPWPLIAKAVKANRGKLYPSKWGVFGLIAGRSLFG
jgi:hypothetical protein